MSENYKSVFDIIGPVMVGPSSSHTAGAVMIGQVAHKLFLAPLKKITVAYYESFAQTHQGHGTDYAIVAGILGMQTDDLRVPNAVELARDQGIEVIFKEMPGNSPIKHPNTAIITLENEFKKITVAGCSIGGGTIEIRKLEIDGQTFTPLGPLPIMLCWGVKDIPKSIKKSLDQGNVKIRKAVAPVKLKEDYLCEFDLDKIPHQNILEQIKAVSKNLICL
ncbi:serine dehydratase beta chain [Ligilactobacillus faecis]|uniref:L-serine deaminase n=1 Tax=Ligilactobacillus faecis TaxID=762833 RepID=A0ABV4DMT4_9LACO